jgi:hypothetical protein
MLQFAPRRISFLRLLYVRTRFRASRAPLVYPNCMSLERTLVRFKALQDKSSMEIFMVEMKREN